MERAVQPGSDVAERIVLSYRSVESDRDRERWRLADDDWIRDELRRDSYLGYLKKVHGGRVAVGDKWEEFISCGCSSPEDVVLRVEAVEGGTVFGDGTEVELVHRRDVLAA